MICEFREIHLNVILSLIWWKQAFNLKWFYRWITHQYTSTGSNRMQRSNDNKSIEISIPTFPLVWFFFFRSLVNLASNEQGFFEFSHSFTRWKLSREKKYLRKETNFFRISFTINSVIYLNKYHGNANINVSLDFHVQQMHWTVCDDFIILYIYTYRNRKLLE